MERARRRGRRQWSRDARRPSPTRDEASNDDAQTRCRWPARPRAAFRAQTENASASGAAEHGRRPAMTANASGQRRGIDPAQQRSSIASTGQAAGDQPQDRHQPGGQLAQDDLRYPERSVVIMCSQRAARRGPGRSRRPSPPGRPASPGPAPRLIDRDRSTIRPSSAYSPPASIIRPEERVLATHAIIPIATSTARHAEGPAVRSTASAARPSGARRRRPDRRRSRMRPLLPERADARSPAIVHEVIRRPGGGLNSRNQSGS